MVITCAALGCRKKQNSVDDNGNKISFHRFPKNKELCQAWLEAAKREDFVPTKFSYLCSEHFTDDLFNRTHNPNSTRLKPKAVPNVFNGFDSSRKKVSPVKKSAKIATDEEPEDASPPKQIYDVQNHVKIAPRPERAMRPEKVLIDTVTPSNIAPAMNVALNAFNQTTSFSLPSELGNGTPVSIYIVRPQADGSSIVTIPSPSPLNLGGITTANVSTLSTANLSSFTNLGTICNAVNRVISVPGSQTGMPGNPISSDNDSEKSEDDCENLESSSDGSVSEDRRDEEIKKCQERLKNYKKIIKLLHQRHRRQKKKIEMLQGEIKELKYAECADEGDDISEDISEEEIFEELLKHQSESDFEDIDDYLL